MSALCRGCGAPIVWLATDAGKKMPVEVNEVAETYQRDGAVYDPEDPDLIPHWGNCPAADSFRKRD